MQDQAGPDIPLLHQRHEHDVHCEQPVTQLPKRSTSWATHVLDGSFRLLLQHQGTAAAALASCLQNTTDRMQSQEVLQSPTSV